MHCKRTMMPYMKLVMIEVTWEPSTSKTAINCPAVISFLMKSAVWLNLKNFLLTRLSFIYWNILKHIKLLCIKVCLYFHYNWNCFFAIFENNLPYWLQMLKCQLLQAKQVTSKVTVPKLSGLEYRNQAYSILLY